MRLACVPKESDTDNGMRDTRRPLSRATSPNEDLGLAVLVAEADSGYEPVAVISTDAEARAISNADYEARLARVGRGEEPFCPERYAVWTRAHDGSYQRGITINPNAPTGDRVALGETECRLIITSDGFLNVAQACELRLRYEDVNKSDTVSGIDVVLANGTTKLLEHNDPGFDQLIELIEDQGYTISTPKP